MITLQPLPSDAEGEAFARSQARSLLILPAFAYVESLKTLWEHKMNVEDLVSESILKHQALYSSAFMHFEADFSPFVNGSCHRTATHRTRTAAASRG